MLAQVPSLTLTATLCQPTWPRMLPGRRACRPIACRHLTRATYLRPSKQLSPTRPVSFDPLTLAPYAPGPHVILCFPASSVVDRSEPRRVRQPAPPRPRGARPACTGPRHRRAPPASGLPLGPTRPVSLPEKVYLTPVYFPLNFKTVYFTP